MTWLHGDAPVLPKKKSEKKLENHLKIQHSGICTGGGHGVILVHVSPELFLFILSICFF
jgi:hypothetical protein